MRSESDIEQKTCDLVWQLLGVKGSKLKIIGENGFPDRIFWIPGGKPFLIEFKKPGEDPEPLQTENHDVLRKLDYKIEVHDNEYEACEAIINYLETTRLSKRRREVLAQARSRCAVLRSRAR